MDRLWLNEYPAGVPHNINPDEYTSVVALLEDSLKHFADQPVTVCMDVWMTYGELDMRSQQLGAWLQSLNLAPDARVARCLAELFNPLLYPSKSLRLDITQEEIGYLARISRQRTNQALRALEEARLVHVEYGAVQVLDLDGLKHYGL